MDLATLISSGSEDTSGPLCFKALKVWCHQENAAEAGLTVRRGLRNEGLLTSVHRGRVVVDVVDTPYRQLRPTADNPFLTAEQLSQLDADGIAKLGETLEENAVLVSILSVDKAAKPSVKGMRVVRDRTERLPLGWGGAVIESVERFDRARLGRGTARELRERIELTLRLERELETGDVLCTPTATLGIVGRFVEHIEVPGDGAEGADLAIGFETGGALNLAPGLKTIEIGKSKELAAFYTHARTPADSVSLISRQPIGQRMDRELGTPRTARPAALTPAHVGWLRERNLDAILDELTSLKSDDIPAHAAMLRAANQKVVPAAGTPNTLYRLRANLMSLGLSVEFQRGDTATEMTLRPATRAELLSQSSGLVKKPETLNFRTLEGETDGLMCPAVFGSGYRFGHIELSAPIVPYLWMAGPRPPLERLLRLSSQEIRQIVYGESYIRRDGTGLQWQSSDGEPPNEADGWSTGAAAIRSLLQSDDLPSGIIDRPETLVQDAVLIPPIYLRPLVMLDNSSFATSDLNDLYRQMINSNNRLAALVRMNAPPALLRRETCQLQQSADVLWGNCLLTDDATMRDDNRQLTDLTQQLISGLTGDLTKREDWSGHARAVVDRTLDHSQAAVPHIICQKLQIDVDDVVLLSAPDRAPTAAARVVPSDGLVLRLSSTLHRQLELANSTDGFCAIQILLGSDAIEQARGLLNQVPPATRQLGHDPLVDASTFETAFSTFVDRCLDSRTISFDSPRGLLISGNNHSDFAELEVPDANTGSPTREIPA